jgi:hypothetical protein
MPFGRPDAPVEDQAVAVAFARQRAQHIEALRHHADLAWLETLTLHPVEDVFADLGLPTGRAFDLTQCQCEIDKFVKTACLPVAPYDAISTCFRLAENGVITMSVSGAAPKLASRRSFGTC